ncbi:uncharacterized protein LOC110860375 [Folsomia candida]|uniref:uncharacterized protein LOC110860375 n=1 Tax=Folsomia candida TaxID=158441 RepID=UPI000B8F52B6|nr:uncharacterized protein LOC110860375 [Folsomia candida]
MKPISILFASLAVVWTGLPEVSTLNVSHALMTLIMLLIKTIMNLNGETVPLSPSVLAEQSTLGDQVQVATTQLRASLNDPSSLPVVSAALLESQLTQLQNSVNTLVPILNATMTSLQTQLDEALAAGNVVSVGQIQPQIPVVGKLLNAVTEIPLVGDLIRGILTGLNITN